MILVQWERIQRILVFHLLTPLNSVHMYKSYLLSGFLKETTSNLSSQDHFHDIL